ncbi:MAG TPA: hypothetical protein VLB80_00640 [Candidatus Babeliales bacterium]|nr:hypothetical protein [Candidatus Babeliales bacterium]
MHIKKLQKNKQYNRYPLQDRIANACNCGGKPPKHEDDKEEHPNGIYENAKYHHKNSNGCKNVCPKDGQWCLDNSFSVGDSVHRISIEDGMFVILKQTAPRKFHGYIIKTWGELCNKGSATQLIRNAFINNGLVNRSGKVIAKNI